MNNDQHEEHVVNHPQNGRVTYIAVRPMHIGSEDGATRRVQVGDALTASEVAAARHQLRRLKRNGYIIEVPADRGVVESISHVLGKLNTLEKAVGELAK